jgi:transposase
MPYIVKIPLGKIKVVPNVENAYPSDECRLACYAGSMRAEILDGVERRRRWSEDEKARIIEEGWAAGAKVADVARKHGVSRSLIFAWRRQARTDVQGEPRPPRLVPVHVAVPSPPALVPPPLPKPPHAAKSNGKKSGLIEIDLGGGKRIRVDGDVDADALSRVLDVLKRR